VLFIYITRLASNKIFSPSNKIHREVGRAKDLSAPLLYIIHRIVLLSRRPEQTLYNTKHLYSQRNLFIFKRLLTEIIYAIVKCLAIKFRLRISVYRSAIIYKVCRLLQSKQVIECLHSIKMSEERLGDLHCFWEKESKLVSFFSTHFWFPSSVC
jgi:hypothetical protein